MKKSIIVGLAVAVFYLLFIPSVCSAQERTQSEPVTLIRGLDGGTCETYLPAVIEKAQGVLSEPGLYEGEINSHWTT